MADNEHILRLLTEEEGINRNNFPLKYGISPKCAKRIFELCSVVLINKPLGILRHYNKNSVFFRIKADYLQNLKQKTYCLTIEMPKIKGNAEEINRKIKEYFYFKFVLFLMFKGNRAKGMEILLKSNLVSPYADSSSEPS
ncbi:hypothetical protein IKQ26_01090 [bacterium]|nr:hypothetical protein [bacterium]